MSTRQTELTSSAGPLEVHVLLHNPVNFALAFNRVPLVRGLAIANTGETELGELSAEITCVTDFGDPLFEDVETTLAAPAPGMVLTFEPPAVMPDIGLMAQVDEATSATIRVRVSAADGTSCVVSAPIDVLAYNQWVADAGLFEILATFVLPNHPAVTRVLQTASAILGESTGDPSLQGYQAGSERALQIAKAIFKALQAERIVYSEPPASFSDKLGFAGQKLRTPDQVLGDRMGTCIDLALTYSACMEQAGLFPLIWIVDGHAFAGFMKTEQLLREPAELDPNAMINLFEAGRVVPVETVALTKPDVSFENAASETTTWFHQPDTLRALIDVRRSRRGGIRPLPSRSRSGDGGLVVQTEAARAPELPPSLRPDSPSSTQLAPESRAGTWQEDKSPPRVQQWKASLLDLSLRNPLLNLNTRRSGLELVVPEGTIGRVEDMVHAGVRLELTASDDLDAMFRAQGVRLAQELTAEVLEPILNDRKLLFAALPLGTFATRARSLKRKAQSVLEETGANNLYLTVGSLNWQYEGRELVSPIFLIPVEMDGGVRRKPFGLRLEDGGFSTPNHCLLERLRISFGLRIPEMERPDLDDHGVDIDAAFRAVRNAIADARLPFRVDETATLSMLDFSTFRLWKDLDQNWSEFMQNAVVRHLVESPTQQFEEPDGSSPTEVNEASLLCPVSSDGSQMEAIALAAQGRSFVLEGPPGTGKSQTITNLIANALASGKKVLFVAEKAAALEVVKRRLDSVGLEPFCVELHSKGTKPADVRKQLIEALDFHLVADQLIWDQKLKQYKATLSDLAHYPADLHAANEAGLSVWSAVQTLLEMDNGPTADISATYVTSPQASRLTGEDALDEWVELARYVRLGQRRAWSLADSSEGGFDAIDRPALTDAVHVLSAPPADERAARIVAAAETPEWIGSLASWAQWALTGDIQTAETVFKAMTPAWRQSAQQMQSQLDLWGTRNSLTTTRFSHEVLNTDLDAIQQEAQIASSSFFIGRSKKLRAVEARLQPFAISAAAFDGDIVEIAAALVAERDQANQLRDQALRESNLQLPTGWSPAQPGAADAFRRAAQTVVSLADFAASLPGFEISIVEFLGSVRSGATATDQLSAFASAWSTLAAATGSSTASLQRWRDGRTLDQARAESEPDWMADARDSRFLSLQRELDLSAARSGMVRAGLADFAAQLESADIPAADAHEALRRGVAKASLDERMQSTGLDHFDGHARDRRIVQYLERSKDLRGLMPDKIAADLVASRPFPPGIRRGEVGELARELGRTRGAVSIRALLSKYAEIVATIAPCFLMSPDSVARFIPPGSVKFDLVVFDEASQLRVADSIGVMGRADSVIVVGDSQQMPPSSIAEISRTVEDEALPAEELVVPEDLESILSECVESNLPRKWLSCHYRSQDESLIAFSNHKYYEGRLTSFPAPLPDNPTMGVRFRRVEGRFDRGKSRTNEVEARAIIAEIQQRLADPSRRESTIGVVTFNKEQQTLIEDLLDQLDDPNVASAREAGPADKLFVKNLENVQGDERDVIFFSLAFSVDPDTGKLPLNFGPLNRARGERRLNVAITRARREVVLFASFSPSDINLSRTASKGLEHLRSYLEMAESGARGSETLAAFSRGAPDLHRQRVADALEARGLRVKADYGLSDFKVDLAVGRADEEDFRVAVLLDGPGWAKRPTTSDRDGLPNLLHHMMAWPEVKRVWLPSYLAEPDSILESIEAAVLVEKPVTAAGAAKVDVLPRRTASLEHPALSGDDPLADETPTVLPTQAGESPPSPAPSVPDAPVELVRLSDTELDAVTVLPLPVADPLQSMPPYVSADSLEIQYMPDILDNLLEPRIRQAVFNVVLSIIEIEAPIEAERLAKVTANRFGLSRVSATRVRDLRTLIPPDQTTDSPWGTFVWPRDVDPSTWRLFRPTPGGVKRPLDLVASEEIINAMVWLVDSGVSMDPAELVRETSLVFGSSRLTAQRQQQIELTVELAIQQQRLTRIDGRVRVGTS